MLKTVSLSLLIFVDGGECVERTDEDSDRVGVESERREKLDEVFVEDGVKRNAVSMRVYLLLKDYSCSRLGRSP